MNPSNVGWMDGWTKVIVNIAKAERDEPDNQHGRLDIIVRKLMRQKTRCPAATALLEVITHLALQNRIPKASLTNMLRGTRPKS